eukprot:SAG31_NODE_145_length_22612_cov_5.938169_22_plen_436_part_01
MRLFAETKDDLKKYLKLTYTDATDGMPLAIWFTPIYAEPLIDFVRGLHLTRALPLCLDPGSSFQSSVHCLLLDHGCSCDLDQYGTHHLLNVSLLPPQQDRSDLMKAPRFDTGSAYACGGPSFTEPECFHFGSSSTYESDVSSSTEQCSSFDSGSSFGCDVPFLAKIAVDAESAHGFGPPSSTDTMCLSYDTRFALESDLHISNEIPSEHKAASGSENPSSTDIVCLPFEPKTAYEPDVPFSDKTVCLPCGLQSELECGTLDSSGHLGTTKISFDCETAHEPDVPDWTETPVETESAHDDFLDWTDTVCVPSEPGPACAPGVPCSKEIPSEPETAYGSEKPSSTDTVCLSSEPEAPYESDILDSTDSACLPCELGPAYVSDVLYTTDIPVETESACGSDILTLCLSYDTRFALESDILDSNEIPSEHKAASGSENPS